VKEDLGNDQREPARIKEEIGAVNPKPDPSTQIAPARKSSSSPPLPPKTAPVKVRPLTTQPKPVK
jgi:hypothetical protein